MIGSCHTTLCHAMHRPGGRVRRGAMLPLLLACLTLPGGIAIASVPPPAASPASQPADPLSMLPGNSNAWSVSRIETGCYLISPRRSGSSSLAIGRNTKLGLGLFLVNLPLAVPVGGAKEPVVIRTEDTKVIGAGQVVGRGTLFVPLDDAKADLSLQELRDTGTLWVMLRHTWIAHDGHGIVAALAEYARTCTTSG